MYSIAADILKKEKLPFALLNPLIEETAAKIKNSMPSKMQTGPAIRKDKQVMDAHIKLLSDKKNIQKLYKMISKNIEKNKSSK